MRIELELTEIQLEELASHVAERLQNENGDSDGWLRGAGKIAAYIDCPASRVYALSSANRIPVHHDGSALVARRSELDRWMANGGGLRP